MPYKYVAVDLPEQGTFKMNRVASRGYYMSRKQVDIDAFAQWCRDNEGELTPLAIVGQK